MDRINTTLYLFVIALVFTFSGCQSDNNPWSGTQYYEPEIFSNPPQSIYAPNATLLPQRDAKEITGGGSQDAELESILMDL